MYETDILVSSRLFFFCRKLVAHKATSTEHITASSTDGSFSLPKPQKFTDFFSASENLLSSLPRVTHFSDRYTLNVRANF